MDMQGSPFNCRRFLAFMGSHRQKKLLQFLCKSSAREKVVQIPAAEFAPAAAFVGGLGHGGRGAD
jgi:hypothetical protein